MAKNFRYLDDLIHSGAKEIALDSDIVLDSDEESVYKKGIRVDVDELVINGEGHTIDARHKARIFICNGRNITLKNITLKNGHSRKTSGTIINYHCKLTIRDSTIEGSTSMWVAGAIGNIEAELTIIRSVLSGNFSDASGGAICNEKAEMNIIECTLRGNSSEKMGGAIHNTKAKLTIIGSAINGNSSEMGGAIINNAELTIVESTLGGNASKRSGGAIYNNGEFTMTDSALTGNTSKRSGGAIYNNEEAKLTIIKSTLTGNTAKEGGAINNSFSKTTLMKSIFSKNTADNSGGAIFTNSYLKINNCIFKSNSAKEDGGAICNYGEFTMTDSTLSGNASEKLGGAIYNSNAIIFESDIYESVINKSQIIGNASEYDGGAIYNEMNVLKINHSKINGNRVHCRQQNIISNLDGYLKIVDSEISNNGSLGNIIFNDDHLQIYATTFMDNISKHVIDNEGDLSKSGIFNGKFIDNEVSESVIFNEGKTFTIERSVFENNIIYNDSNNIINQGNLNLIDLEIRNNEQTILNKGSIFLKKSPHNLKDQIYGDGIVESNNFVPTKEQFDFGYFDEKILIKQDYEDDFVKITFEGENKIIKLKSNLKFQDYEKDFYEGGIELGIDNLTIDGDGYEISGANKSRIFIITGTHIRLRNISFKNGHSHRNYDSPANSHGGVIKINNDSILTIENCLFSNNFSEAMGGVIVNYGGKFTAIESTFSRNTAENGGGAIYNYNGKMTIRESTFTENTAEYCGGAIYNIEGVLTITNSTFSENITKESDDTIANEGKTTLNHCIIDGKLHRKQHLKNIQTWRNPIK